MNILLVVLGFSRTNLASEIGQLTARTIFAFISIEFNDARKGPFIFLALFAFAIAEPIRYPYYFLKTLELDNSLIGRLFGHLRYNLFIVFYPLGAFSDLMAGVYSAKNIENQSVYSYELPNEMNFAFDYPWFITYIVPVFYMIAFPVAYMYLF